METDKLKIELKPSDAIRLVSFLSEFESDLKKELMFTKLVESIGEFSSQVFNQLTNEQLDDIVIEDQINKALGLEPDTKN